jgi:hypothetical protein
MSLIRLGTVMDGHIAPLLVAVDVISSTPSRYVLPLWLVTSMLEMMR